jgi:hypothetical protein
MSARPTHPSARKLLSKYWIVFVSEPDGAHERKFGVTAYSRDDAVALVREAIGSPDSMPLIDDLQENVAFEDLDQGHVAPSMHPMSERGVWYPKMEPFR